jgi:hypothetical protein
MTLDPDVSKGYAGQWTRCIYLDFASNSTMICLSKPGGGTRVPKWEGGDAVLVMMPIREMRPEGAVLDCENAVGERRRLFLPEPEPDGSQVFPFEAFDRMTIATLAPRLMPVTVDGHEMLVGMTYLEVGA